MVLAVRFSISLAKLEHSFDPMIPTLHLILTPFKTPVMSNIEIDVDLFGHKIF